MPLMKGERDLLSYGLYALGIEVNQKIMDRFSLFIEELFLWNSKTNLVGTSSRREVIIRHIFDSLSVYNLLKNRKGSILDVGAGAGFPSIPLAIVDDTLSIYAVERRARRASFLKNAAVLLKIDNFSVLECDMRDVKGLFDTILARGVAELARLYDFSKGLMKERSMIIAFKGKITEIEKEVARLKGKAADNREINLRVQKVKVPYLDEEERNIVIIETK